MAAVQMIRSSADFARAARLGRKWSGALFTMQKYDRSDDLPMRLGLTASRKVGNAIIRNRAKRRLKEAVRLLIKNHPRHGCDLVLIARTAVARVPFAQIQDDLARGLKMTEIPKA